MSGARSRALLGWGLCGLAMLTGLCTAALASRNRGRGDELDQVERWCEVQSRRNELQRVANQRQECRLLGLAPGAPSAVELAP